MSRPFVFEKKLLTPIKGRDMNAIRKNICGEQIGHGLYRDVYELKFDPRYVVKIEVDMSQAVFANATEWRNYINNKEWKWFEQWLAPCMLISETGQWMIQRRVNWKNKTKKDYPKEIPSMFTDTKYDNFGWIGNRLVCCDYSYIPFTLPKTQTKRAKWWGDSANIKAT